MSSPLTPFVPPKHCTEDQAKVLSELHDLFALDKPDLLKVIEAFNVELNAGLTDDKSSDLNMIPSFVTGKLLVETDSPCFLTKNTPVVCKATLPDKRRGPTWL